MNEDFDPFEEEFDGPFGRREIPVIREGMLAKTPKAQHEEDYKNFDRREVLRMNDKALANWQAQFESDEPQWILAAHEWQRRIAGRQIHAANIVGRKANITTVVAAIVGALVGAALTLLIQSVGKGH